MGVRFAIIGCGRVGQKRQACLADQPLSVACDVNLELARDLVRKAGSGRAVQDFREAVAAPDVDAVIVSTLNASLPEITLAAVRAGKDVLVEKPAALRAAQLDPIMAEATARGRTVRVGFNHRYHPALRKAREIIDSGELGPLMFVRGRYGHGGRVGYDKEWRADPALSGGGELIDQGVHLIDLARWFLGEFERIEGHAATFFWNMPVDDNAFLSLRTASGQTAWLHASCTEWKNLFSFEIYGRNGKLHVEGLGGSYGAERLHHYKMQPEMGPPDTATFEFQAGDDSWQTEFHAFLEDIRTRRAPDPGLRDAAAALRVVETIYQNSGLP